MAQDNPQRFWVLGDGEGYIGTYIRNGVHLITAIEGRTFVKVAREGKRYRRVRRLSWDALPKVLDSGQSFPEALTQLREAQCVALVRPRGARKNVA